MPSSSSLRPEFVLNMCDTAAGTPSSHTTIITFPHARPQSSGSARPVVKKRASLALLRLIRKTPPEHTVVSPDSFSGVINNLLDERNLGLLLSATTLLQGICARNGPGMGVGGGALACVRACVHSQYAAMRGFSRSLKATCHQATKTHLCARQIHVAILCKGL